MQHWSRDVYVSLHFIVNLLTATVTQNLINNNSRTKVHVWLADFIKRHVFVVNQVINSFAITGNMKQNNQFWFSEI